MEKPKKIDNLRFFVCFGLWGVGMLGFLAGSLGGDLGFKSWEYVGHVVGPIMAMTGIGMGFFDNVWKFFFTSENKSTSS